ESRFQFPEVLRFQDIWNQDRLLAAQESGDVPGSSGCAQETVSRSCRGSGGLVDSGVTQTPRYLIKARGQRGTLGCSPVSGHLSVYWYQQALGQGPEFLVEYYSQEVRGEAQLPDRFSGKQFSDFHSELNLSSLELTDSAVYLCASSQDTALHDQVPLGQKHSCPSSGSGCEGTACLSGLDRSDRLSQTFFLCCVLMLPNIILGCPHLLGNSFEVPCDMHTPRPPTSSSDFGPGNG
uniref:Ig-like domain-containing protein n=1 Tax=Bos indicus x Bos taurus TaxID=30522 RepID=A0A4W2FE21_BOBOX